MSKMLSKDIVAPVLTTKQVCFYKQVCNDPDITDCYVGSTYHFTHRRKCHKNNCANPNSKSYHIKLYQFIRDNGGWANWSMIVIDNVPCDDRNDSRLKERAFMVQLHATLNLRVPSRTQSEYMRDNKDVISAYRTEYDASHREDKHKYYIKHIDAITEYKQTKVACTCGGRYTLSNKSKHDKTEIHIRSLKIA